MLTITRILVPTDYSDTSAEAVKYGVALAKQYGATLHVLHVAEKAPAEVPGNVEFPLALFETMRDDAWKQLRRVLTETEMQKLAAKFATRVGSPQAEIVRFAREQNVDVIVMGTNGRSGVAHMLMGSVAEHVIRTAPCPVLTVRHRAAAGAAAA